MRVKQMDAKRVQAGLLSKRLGGSLSNLASEDLFRAAKNGDALSLQLVEEIGRLNAIGFANIINAYEPSLITVGGTVVLRNSQLVLEPIRKHVGVYALNRVPKIMATPLGNDAGIY
jgi:glucokinase